MIQLDLVYLDHVEQRQFGGNSSVTEDLDPVPLAA